MIGFCRQRYPELSVVVGGGLVTSWLSRPKDEKPGWCSPFAGLIDHLIAGPGERGLLELLGSKFQLEDPKCDQMLPDYADFSDLSYLAPGLILPYAASSGCYWNRCSFCPEKAEGNRYRQTAPQTVVSELKKLVQTMRPGLIHFLDNAMMSYRNTKKA